MPSAGSKVTYEWDMEPTYDSGDIIDHNHADRLSELKAFGSDPHRSVDGDGKPMHLVLVLVRDLWDEWGLLDRQWAYLEDDGSLPERFDGGAKVPKKFKLEFERHKEWAGKFISIFEQEEK